MVFRHQEFNRFARISHAFLRSMPDVYRPRTHRVACPTLCPCFSDAEWYLEYEWYAPIHGVQGEEEAWTALIIWRDPKGTISAGTAGQLAAYTCKCRCVLKASSLAEIEAEIDRVSPGGSLVRVGRPGVWHLRHHNYSSFWTI